MGGPQQGRKPQEDLRKGTEHQRQRWALREVDKRSQEPIAGRVHGGCREHERQQRTAAEGDPAVDGQIGGWIRNMSRDGAESMTEAGVQDRVA